MNPIPGEIHFDCPRCKRPMVGDKALLGETINCPDCSERFVPSPRKSPLEPIPDGGNYFEAMKIFKVIFAAFLILIIAGFGYIFVSGLRERGRMDSYMSNPGDNEYYPHKLARYRAGADAALRAACTNYTVGLRAILSQRTETYDDNFMKWTATATVEFINRVGGVDRTNLNFGSSPDLGRMDWYKK